MVKFGINNSKYGAYPQLSPCRAEAYKLARITKREVEVKQVKRSGKKFTSETYLKVTPKGEWFKWEDESWVEALG